jgi:hypothetical protein
MCTLGSSAAKDKSSENTMKRCRCAATLSMMLGQIHQILLVDLDQAQPLIAIFIEHCLHQRRFAGASARR